MHLAGKRVAIQADREELFLKIGQGRALVSELQAAFDQDRLSMENVLICEEFRCLILTLHWVAFYGRTVIERSAFKKMMLLEAGLSRLLIDQGKLDSPGIR
jgi:hypothetical protein